MAKLFLFLDNGWRGLVGICVQLLNQEFHLV